MPVLLRFRVYLIVVLLYPSLGLAKDAGVFINKLTIYSDQQHYYLNADVQFRLNPTVEKALRNGVSLVWAMHYKVWKKRKFIWDQELVNITQYYRIRYHALFKHFQIMDEQSHSLARFISLRAAFSQLGKIRAVRLISKNNLADKSIYEAGLQITLDKEQLPLALRAEAHINSDWSLTSQWQKRPLKSKD